MNRGCDGDHLYRGPLTGSKASRLPRPAPRVGVEADDLQTAVDRLVELLAEDDET